jgi:hypothetical protein
MMRIRGEIRGDSDKLRSELAAVCRFQEFLRQKIADDEDAWADGRRQLNRPVDTHVVKAVRATRVRLEKELGERGASVAAMGQVKRLFVSESDREFANMSGVWLPPASFGIQQTYQARAFENEGDGQKYHAAQRNPGGMLSSPA